MPLDRLKDASTEVLAVFSISGRLQFATYATILLPAVIMVMGSLMFRTDASSANPIVASVTEAIGRWVPWAALVAFIKLAVGTIGLYQRERRRLFLL